MRDTIEIFEPQNNLENAHIASRILVDELPFGMVKKTPFIDKVINACLDMGYEMAVTGDWLVFGKTVKTSQDIVMRTMSILSECLLVDRSGEDYLFPVKPWVAIGAGFVRGEMPVEGSLDESLRGLTRIAAIDPDGSNPQLVEIRFSMFRDKVADGTKRHTIRKQKMASSGDYLELRELGNLVGEYPLLTRAICTHVDLIDVDASLRHVNINSQQLTGEEIEALALADGFDNSEAFWEFFEDGVAGGFLIHWEPIASA